MKNSKHVLFIFVFVLNAIFAKSQTGTCSDPEVVIVNTGFTPLNTFSSSSWFIKFTPTSDITTVKIYFQNFNPMFHFINVYNNDCLNLPANKLNQPDLGPQIDPCPMNVDGDNIEISSSFLSGQEYLIELGQQVSDSRSSIVAYSIEVNSSNRIMGCFGTNPCATPTCELLCNGGFEGMSSGGVTNFSQLYKADSWFNPTPGGTGSATPDLYSTTANSGFKECGVPCNFDGTRAHLTTTCSSQNNYAVILNTYIPPPYGSYQYSEEIETQLKSPLVGGKSYIISFYVSKGTNGDSKLKKLACWLTPSMINIPNWNTAIPIGSYTPAAVLTNSTALNGSGWTKLSFCYTPPVSGDQFLTIGIPDDPTAFAVGTNTALNDPSYCTSGNTNNPGFLQSNNHTLFIDEVSVIPFDYSTGITQTVSPCGTVTLSATAATCGTTNLGSMSYNWSGPGVNTNSLTAVTTVTTGSGYTFYASGIASDGGTCQVFVPTIVVSTTPVPLVITPSSASVCPGSTVSLTASGGTGAYTWLPGGSTSNPVVFTPTANTTYSVVGTTTNGCTITQTITIYTYTDVITASASPTAICSGFTSTLTANGGSSFSWTPSSLTGSLVIVTPTISTTYTVSGITSLHSCSKTATVNLIVNPLPTLTISPAVSNTICLNDPITLIASGASTYTWQSPSTVSSSITVSPTINTTYTVTGASSFGCISTQTAFVFVNPLPIVNCSTNKPIVCQGSTATLTATGTNTFVWFPGGPGASIVINPTSTVTPLNYTVMGTNTLTGCTNTCIVTQNVFISGTPFFTVTATPSVVCNSAPATTLTATGSPNSYTWVAGTSTIANSSTLALSGSSVVSTTYSVASTNSLGCFGKQTFTVQGTDDVASFNTLPVICGILPIDLSTYLSSTLTAGTYSVNGVQITGSTYTFSSASSSYTIGYTYTAGILCNNTATAVITSNTACCTSTNAPITSTLLSGTNFISGGKMINQNLTITGITYLEEGEFVIAPNVKITIATGGELYLRGAHLYACKNNMWDGIEVQYDGFLISGEGPINNMSTLIEDAKIAVDVRPITSPLTFHPMPLEINNTIFNKNYICINYNTISLSSDLPMQFQENVMTCRTLTFTPTSWPSTSTVSPGLRSATSSTTGLSAPYSLQAATPTLCIPPYSAHPTRAGFQLTDAGIANTSYGLEIGESGTSTEDPYHFNLFDQLAYCIYAQNSNVSVFNNVFQNTRYYRTPPPKPKWVGGSAIYHNSNNDFFYKLNLTNTVSVTYSNTPDVANRFWNCHMAVEATDLYLFNMDYNIVRSTQSVTAGSGYLPGNTGIFSATNRFSYFINKNEFTNVRYPVNISIGPNTYNTGTVTTTGVYAHNLAIINNYIAPQTATSVAFGTNYVSDAITVSNPNTASWFVVPFTGLSINTNTIHNAYRGVSVNGMNSYSISIKDNTISDMNDDLLFGADQFGINLSKTLRNVIITTNTLSAIGNTNNKVTLVYADGNNASSSPSITCNSLTNGYKGFNFVNANSGMIWKGNLMQNHKRGMSLTSSGIIGQQGGTGAPSDNQWLGAWTGNDGTYVSPPSNASLSILYVQSIYSPPNPGGIGSPANWYTGTNVVVTTGSFSCTGGGGPGPGGSRLSNTGPGRQVGSLVQTATNNAYRLSSGVDLSEDLNYILNFSLYKTLDVNDSLRNSDSSNIVLYNSLSTTSIGKFVQADKYYYSGQASSANALVASVTPTNNVEDNYIIYYGLFDKYLDDDFDGEDSVSLYTLANYCVGTNGGAVNQARSLYNKIFKTVFASTENCDESTTSERKFTTNKVGSITEAYQWDVNLYPNPTSGELNILSRNDGETLSVTIRDASGKQVLAKNLIINGFIGKLDLGLSNGIYIITVTNRNNESVTKKLVITN